MKKGRKKEQLLLLFSVFKIKEETNNSVIH